MRSLRVIDLDGPPALKRSDPPPNESGRWERFTKINTGYRTGFEKRWREGDILFIEREIHKQCETPMGEGTEFERTLSQCPAIVQYADIADQATFEIDTDESREPWADCDGYQHTEIEVGLCQEMLQGKKNPRGLYRHTRGGGGVLVLDDKDQAGLYNYYHERGASKQVARELAAVTDRRTLDQLVEWYADGWWWYRADCVFFNYEACCSGYMEEDADCAIADVIAEVIHDMVIDGFTVVGQPLCVADTRMSRDKYRQHLRNHLNAQNWKYP